MSIPVNYYIDSPTIAVAVAATDHLDDMSSWLNVLQSVQLPFALLPILHFTSNHRIMGDFENGRILKFCVWMLGGVVMGINFYLVTLFLGESNKWYVYLITSLVIVVYVIFILYLALGVMLFTKLQMKLMEYIGLDISSYESAIQRRYDQQYPVVTNNQPEPRSHSSSDV